jgi:cell division protein FtsB
VIVMVIDGVTVVLLIVLTMASGVLGAMLYITVIDMKQSPVQQEEREIDVLERRARQLERETDALGQATRSALLREALRRTNQQGPDEQ